MVYEASNIDKTNFSDATKNQRLTEELNKNIQSLSIPSWLVKSRTVLIKEKSTKGNAVGKYRLTACLCLL